jgi:hypothetical protein
MASSPVALAFRPPAFAAAAARYVYVAGSDAWYDVRTGSLFSRASLDGLLAHQFERSPSRTLLNWGRTSKVERLRYLPGTADLVFERSGEWCLNRWKPSTLQPSSGDWSRIAQLIAGLLPVAEQRDHLLDVLAHLVQVPAGKTKHALVLTGVPGCGKTSLAKLAGMLVGERNYKEADGYLLTGRWLNPFVDCQVLTIEEVMHGDRFEVSDKLKTLITAPEITVEAKNVDFFSGHTPNLVFILSNDRRPLALTEGSRREWMPDFVEGRPDEAFFFALHESLDRELPCFLGALLQRDISGFSADAPPPMTAAKAEAIQDSRPTLVVQLEEMISIRAGPFDRDVFIPAHAMAELRSTGHAVSEAQVKKALKQLGCRPCKNQVAPGGHWAGSPRVWSVRNHDRWADATKTDLRDHLLGSDGSGRSAAAIHSHLRPVV